MIASMRSDLPVGIVTFVFTDVEGSTRLLDELGEGRYSEAMSEHRSRLREVFARHGGVEVDTQGDAFFYVFSEAKGAVSGAAQAQEAFGEGPISVRIGVHTGEPVLVGEGYIGREVHRPARIAAVGHGRQVVLSRTTAELVDADLTDLGEHRLKDFADPVCLYQLGSHRFPPLKTISNTNLPRPASSFVGREREVAEVVALVRSGARLVTLTGPGGSGKTRLAIEAAVELVPEFKAGVFWVGLASVRDPELVLPAVAKTLGAQVELAAHIGERELLLLLDNLEQVVAAVPELVHLVETCPNLMLLVTSRELLRVRGEAVYEVLPLADRDAVELFCGRSDVGAGAAVEQLCRRLDNMPLALELAAARTKALSPAQILERLGSRLDLFRGGRDADPRQQTLRATIEWSHGLLSPGEQQLFRRLGVFAGGCTLEAAQALGEADIDTLQSLVEKSLVRHANDRFWMLETIREYALERLAASGEADHLRRGHAELLVESGEAAIEAAGSEREAWLADLRPDLDNLRETIGWAIDSDPELALRLSWVVPVFQALPNEERRWLDEALAHAAAIDVAPVVRARALQAAAHAASSWGDNDDARPLYEEALDLYRALGDDRSVARVLAGLGLIASDHGDAARGRQLFEQSLVLYRKLDDRDGEWIVLNDLGELERGERDYGRAAELLAEAVVVARSQGDSESVAMSLHGLGDVALELGDIETASRRYRESLRILLGLEGRYRNTCYCLAALAAAAAASGDAHGAGRFWGALQALEEELGMRLPPLARSRYAEGLAGLDEAAFARGLGEGQALGLEAVLDQPTID